MAKQWSMWVKYRNTLRDENVVTQFLWIVGQGGVQIDYTEHAVKETGRHEVKFAGTETFDGFVKWAINCAMMVGGEFCLASGCTECGTILNAKAANCDGMWHQANREPGMVQLEKFMEENFPRAVAQQSGNAALAAINLISLSKSAIQIMWPVMLEQFKTALGHLRRAGVDIPE